MSRGKIAPVLSPPFCTMPIVVEAKSLCATRLTSSRINELGKSW